MNLKAKRCVRCSKARNRTPKALWCARTALIWPRFIIYHVLGETGDENLAEAAIVTLQNAGVVVRNDMDDEFWREIAQLIYAARQMPPDPTNLSKRSNLALGDAFGVCLANRLGGDFVTKDRSEIEPLSDAGLVSALFIR